MLTQKTDNNITFDQQAEVPKVRRVARRVYSKSEIGIQTSNENVAKEMTETS